MCGRVASLVLVFAAAIVALGGASARAAEKVDVLLVLAADVSRSVDDEKFRLQREGYAAALTSARVVRAITSGEHGRIAVSFIEWSGPFNQTIVVDWTVVTGEADARKLASRMINAPRVFRDRTAIGAAIEFSARQIERAPFDATRRVIDVSGDGTNNAGQSVVEARDEVLAKGIAINGIVILSKTPLMTNPTHTHPPGGLLAYYENNVIGGPGAFALAAESFETFGSALAIKLIREISSVPVQGAKLRRASAD